METINQNERLRKITEEALENLCDSLASGKSETLKKYFDFMAQFPMYSFRNILLIENQNPNATRVMGFNGWKKLGRFVKKDEKAIRIWAPMSVKFKQEFDHVEGSNSSESREAEATLIFRPACVFDVSQTEGETLPMLERVSGNPGVFLESLKRFAGGLGIRVGYSDDIRGEGVSKCGEILLRLGLDPAFEFHVLAHEIAHEIIHSREIRKDLSKKQAETEAEAVAYVVSKTIGLETGNASSDYIQTWNGNRETLSDSLAVIQQTATKISQALLV